MAALAQTLAGECPEYTLDHDGDTLVVSARGVWDIHHISKLDGRYRRELEGEVFTQISYDFSQVEALDTAGAYVLAKPIRDSGGECVEWNVDHGTEGQRVLMRATAKALLGRVPPPAIPWFEPFARMGEATVRFGDEAMNTLAFVGRFMMILIGLVGKIFTAPRSVRWKSIVALIEEVGLNAAPIIMVLSFFIGAVIAFMGANILAAFGAQIFLVDLVGFAVVREFAVFITAIMLAGRSASAFTAQLGAMQMRQEIDAMEVIGLDKFNTLIAPRAIACLISMPILTFAAMMSGIFGGMLVAWVGPTDVSPIQFFTRLNEAVDTRIFWQGIVKAPFFGLVIALIGCRQGLSVDGSVTSLGERTTSSVVQAIFVVIVMNAMFAMLYVIMDT